MKKLSILIFLWALVLLSALACTTPHEDSIVQSPPSQRTPQTYVYECSDGTRFTARIEGEKAWLFLPNRTLSLPQVPSGSGAKYGDGRTLFRSKGEEAMLGVGQERPVQCKNNRTAAIWEDAKLRGVAFRAVGNEPGWVLEISADERGVFIGDYGANRLEFTTPKPIVDQNRRTTSYKIQDRKHDLLILLQGQACRDSMKGDSFETRVTVILDGKPYQGCGRALF